MPPSSRSFARGPLHIIQMGLRSLAVLGFTMLLTACASPTRRHVVNPPGISPLVPAYSVAIRHGDTVFVSGMTGIKPGTQDIVDAQYLNISEKASFYFPVTLYNRNLQQWRPRVGTILGTPADYANCHLPAC